MNTFHGFPPGKIRFTRVPDPFFSELLPQIDHLAELKVVLYAIWFVDQMESEPRYLRPADFVKDGAFMAGLAATPEQAAAALADGLERAVQRGVFLCARPADKLSQPLYFVNTAKGRAAFEALQKGEWTLPGETAVRTALKVELPNLFRLYEENIGPLTPMIAETLREAEQTYSPVWIEEAIRLAVENNVRRWRYVEAILRSWKEEGRHETDRRDTEEDRQKYIRGEYGQYVEH